MNHLQLVEIFISSQPTQRIRNRETTKQGSDIKSDENEITLICMINNILIYHK